MLRSYENANLIPLLAHIRKPGRYTGINGVNYLTNAAAEHVYDKNEVIRELSRASSAGHRRDATYVPTFTNATQGFSLGLNPYTDWSLSQLTSKPTHYYLFLGIDWYAVSSLGNAENWFEYLKNPFIDKADLYWQRVWAWILQKYECRPDGKFSWQMPISESDAAAFIRTNGGAFIFHNRIPYLRPAGMENAGTDWYISEWKKPAIQHDAIEDLRLLRELTGPKIVAFCTGEDSRKALIEAGYDPRLIISWKAHPSRAFQPSRFLKDDLWFRGKAYW